VKSAWFKNGFQAALDIEPGDILMLQTEPRNSPDDPVQREQFEKGWRLGVAYIRRRIARGEATE